jgi:hypothetical protein
MLDPEDFRVDVQLLPERELGRRPGVVMKCEDCQVIVGGLGAIEPVSRRCRSTLRTQDSLTEKRAAISVRVPSRASHATTNRWRRSVEYTLLVRALLARRDNHVNRHGQ